MSTLANALASSTALSAANDNYYLRLVRNNRSLTYPAASSENITYTYDATASGNKGIGHLTGITDESGSTTLAYDERGNVVSANHVIGGVSYTTSYAFNPADRLTQITYPSGRSVSFTYDAVGNITGGTTTSGGTTTPLASGGTYYPFGPLKHVAYGNGLIGTFVFDTDYREIFMQTAMPGVNVQLMSLAFDDVDDLKTVTDSLDSTRNQSFTYDKDYRLLTASGKYGSQSFTYDADGNRLTRVTSGGTDTYSYPSGSNKLTSTSSRSLTYTASGDIATDSRGNTYAYNNRSRYSQLTTSGGTTGYKYNAIGQRVSKTVGGTTTHYHYDGQGHLIAETNGSTGATIREYAYLGDTPLAQIESSGSIFYIHNDQVNTPQKMTNSAATIVWDRIQQPFGEDFTTTGTPADNLRFPGQYADSESGLNHNGFRDYDSSLGRYIQADPIGLAGATLPSLGLYGYVANNSLKWIDPLGLAIGDLPPSPPGLNPQTWTQGQWANGKYWVRDPAGNSYTVHREDNGHWRHWDKRDKDNNDQGQCPPNSGKPRENQNKLNENQSANDPNGDAPPWEPQQSIPDNFIPIIPMDPIITPGFPIFEVPPILAPI